MGNRSAQLNIRIEPKVKAEASKFAVQEGTTLAQLVRALLYEWVVRKRVREEEDDKAEEGTKRAEESLWSRIDVKGPDECWEWTGCSINTGYGAITYQHEAWLVHRLVWTLINGAIPDGLCVLHRCDNPPCCNPTHLFLGTQADNVADMHAKYRNACQKGEEASNARLTEGQVREIYRRYHRGHDVSQTELAEEYGVTATHIGYIVRRQFWKHLWSGGITKTEFFRNVDVGEPDDCWEWQKGRSKGYGFITLQGRRWFAHRLIWTIVNDIIPDGLCVMHKCDNPLCCNPAHLLLGTRADNTADMYAKGRERHAEGEAHSMTTLTEGQVLEIHRRCNTGEATKHELAAEYGVCSSTIYRIAREKTWKYLWKTTS